jgi:predicted ester cyclase
VSALRIAAVALMLAACSSDPSKPEAKCPTTTAASSQPEANKAVITHLYAEMWDKRNPDASAAVVAPDLVNHAAIPSAQGAEGFRTIVKKVLVAFPDLTVKPLDVVADGDMVIVRARMEGTHTGTLEFQNPLPPTGKHLRIEQVFGYRLRDGKIVETWMTMDRLDFMQQLGLGVAHG